jgi:2'-5' RNA ligase
MQKRHRVFIAINLPEDIKKHLLSYSEKWPELPAKWTDKNNLHITLEFLGDLTDQEIGDVCEVAKGVSQRHDSFSIDLTKIIFGPPKKMPPRMVWAEGKKSEELSELKKDLEEELLEKISFRPEGRGFTPHITLARIREWDFKKIDLEERSEINEDINLTFTVETIEVMESELKRGGPVYTVLESCELKS